MKTQLDPGGDSPRYANDVMQAMREPLLVLDGALRVRSAMPSFYNAFKATPEQTIGRSFYDLGNGQSPVWPVARGDTVLREGAHHRDASSARRTVRD